MTRMLIRSQSPGGRPTWWRLSALLTIIIFAGTTISNAAVAGAFPELPPVVHLNMAASQQPENITLEPDGSADVTFAFAGQVDRIGPEGKVRVLAQLPIPADGHVPVLGHRSFIAGIVRTTNGTLYVVYSTGTAALTGVWRIGIAQPPVRIASVPPTAMLNGLALDQRNRVLYATDSAQGDIWRIPLSGYNPELWDTNAALAAGPGAPIAIGANGIKVHNGAVWVSNTGQQDIMRIALGPGGRPDTPHIIATGLGVDDFAFTSDGDTILAALIASNEVAQVKPDGSERIILSAANGLSNPTCVGVSRNMVVIGSGAYLTQRDPNLLTVPMPGSGYSAKQQATKVTGASWRPVFGVNRAGVIPGFAIRLGDGADSSVGSASQRSAIGPRTSGPSGA